MHRRRLFQSLIQHSIQFLDQLLSQTEPSSVAFFFRAPRPGQVQVQRQAQDGRPTCAAESSRILDAARGPSPDPDGPGARSGNTAANLQQALPSITAESLHDRLQHYRLHQEQPERAMHDARCAEVPEGFHRSLVSALPLMRFQPEFHWHRLWP